MRAPWLLPTVGRRAVRLVEERPLPAGLMLTAVAVVKLLGALLPLLHGPDSPDGPRAARASFGDAMHGH